MSPGLTAWERWELASFDEAGQDTPLARLNARQQAEGPMPTAEELERIRNHARDEGYQAGYQQGQAAARQEAGRLGRAADILERGLVELEQQTADELLALVLELARQVLMREIAVQPEAILDVVRGALDQLPHQHAAIYLNPEDASLVRSYLGDALTHAGHRIHEDAKLQRGDCILEAGGSQVDGAVATRWRRVLEAIGIESAWRTEDPKDAA